VGQDFSLNTQPATHNYPCTYFFALVSSQPMMAPNRAAYEPTPLHQAELVLKGLVLEWLTVSQDSPLASHTIADLQIRKRTGVSVIAIKRGERIIPNPDPNEKFEVGDLVLLVGTGEQMRRFQETFRVA
jgi:K+/H+ antiporter YhaU regulatory subunit KhtT